MNDAHTKQRCHPLGWDTSLTRQGADPSPPRHRFLPATGPNICRPQACHWYLISCAQRTLQDAGPNGLHSLNLHALSVNGVFLILRIIQTHLSYDGLAMDMPENASQYSVLFLVATTSVLAALSGPCLDSLFLSASSRAHVDAPHLYVQC